jgi:hypothetical protein
MTTGTGPSFPPEVFEAIIDEIALSEEDKDPKHFLQKDMLRVCSLVCKLWLPRSRHYLFDTVIIDYDKRGRRESFLDLLDNPLCTIRPYVRILELEDTPTWVADALPRLSALTQVRDLGIRDGTFFVWRESTRPLGSFQNLQLLALLRCQFHSHTQLFETLSLCTSLQMLFLLNFGLGRPERSIPLNSPPPPRSLRYSEIRNADRNCTNIILEWLVSGEQIPAIDTLKLCFSREEETSGLGHCLRALGPSLKNLELGFFPSAGRFHC